MVQEKLYFVYYCWHSIPTTGMSITGNRELVVGKNKKEAKEYFYGIIDKDIHKGIDIVKIEVIKVPDYKITLEKIVQETSS